MPYAPGQAYDTTSLGAGIADAGKNLAEGFKQYNTNKLMASQAVAKFEGAVQANPEILQFLSRPDAPPDIASAAEKLHKGGGLDVKNAAMLATFADTYTKQKTDAQEQAARKFALQKMQRESASDAAAQQFLQQAGQAQAGQASPLNNAAYQQFTSPMARDAVTLDRMTGKVTPEILAKMQENRDTNAARMATKPELQLGTLEGTNEKGQPTISTIDKNTGKVLGTRVVMPAGVLAPEDAARAAQLTGRVTQAMKDNQDVIDNGKTSVQSLYSIDNTKRLLAHMQAAGNSTGALAPLKAEAQAVAKSLGINIGDPSDMQALNAAIGPMVIGDIKEVTSRMTNMELSAFQKFTANPANTLDANAMILAAREATHQRALQLAQMTNDLRRTPDYKAGKLTEGDINDQVNEYQLKNPIAIPGLKLENPVGGKEKPSVKSIELLKSKPELAPQFDERYGKGAADFYLK